MQQHGLPGGRANQGNSLGKGHLPLIRWQSLLGDGQCAGTLGEHNLADGMIAGDTEGQKGKS